MQVELEDVLKLLEDELRSKQDRALIPKENPYLQYSLLGMAEGVKAAYKRVENHYRREQY